MPSDLDFQYSLTACSETGAGIICLPETNTSWNQFNHLDNTRKIMCRVWDSSTFQVSQSKEKFKSSYQPGGTFSAVTGRWTSRVVDKGEDPYQLGRWSFITLRGKDSFLVTIITGYRVCKSTVGSTGEKTAYKQQYRRLASRWREKNWKTYPDPHRQFILDLQSWIESLVSKGHAIILSLDNNDDISLTQGNYHPLVYDPSVHTISPNHDGSLSTLMKSCDLTDILGEQHTHRPFPATYARGKKRLDYILVSSSIAPSVQKSGILPFHSVFCSDHSPCYIDIDATMLFNELTSPIAPLCQRQLQLTDPRSVSKYIDNAHKQIEYHNIADKYRELCNKLEEDAWSDSDINKYEQIDRLNSESMVFAERNCGNKHTKRFDWSPVLIQAVQAVRYWQHLLKNIKRRKRSTINH
jgi:hypothetical protein